MLQTKPIIVDYARRARILWRIAKLATQRANEEYTLRIEAERQRDEERTLREMAEAENAELRQALRALQYPTNSDA